MYSQKPFCCVAFLASVLLGGCSGGGAGDADRVPVYEVAGKVTLSGAPVANASVTFAPAKSSEKQPVALGRTDSSGNFKLTTYDAEDGAAAGEYIVLVSKAGTASPASDPQAMHAAMAAGQGPPMHSARGPAASSSSSALPEKYSRLDQSDLRATVKAEGENNIPVELLP